MSYAVNSIQLFTTIDLLKYLGLDRVTHIDGTRGTILSQSERFDRLIVQFDTGVTTEQPVSLLRSSGLALLMDLPHRPLMLELRDHDAFTNEFIATPEVITLLRTLASKIRPSSTRGSIEDLLTHATANAKHVPVSIYADLHRLFNSINQDPLDRAIDSLASYPELAEHDFLHLILKIRLLESVLADSCNLLKPVAKFAETINRLAELMPLYHVRSAVVRTIKSRLTFDLKTNKLNDAMEGYQNNIALLGDSWFPSGYRFAKERLEKWLPEQVKDAIKKRHSTRMDELVREARALGLEINYVELEKAELEIGRIESCVTERDYSSLNSLIGCSKTELATTYLKKELKSLVATALSRKNRLVRQGMFKNARALLEEIKPIFPRWRDEAERLDRLEREAIEDQERRRAKLAEEHALEAVRAEEERARVAKFDEAKRAVDGFPDRFVRRAFRTCFDSECLTEKSAELILTWRFNSTEISENSIERVIERCAKGDFDTARLWSARLAEVAALEYWRGAGFEAEDVSIEQLDQNSERWKLYDLRVGNRYVDVKNARASFASKKNFSELCVPRFKEHRSAGQAIDIMGVFSEYKTAVQMAEEGETFKIQVLGTVSAPEIASLEESVRALSDSFVDVKILDRTARPEKFIPGWLFDHAECLYPERPALLNRLPAIIEEWVKVGGRLTYVPLPMRFLAAVYSPAADDHNEWIEPKAFEVMRELIGREGLRLRSVVLGIILACVRCVWLTSSSFQPRDLMGLLFFGNIDDDKLSPLGLHDPLGYCSSVIEVFQVLYEKNREALKGYRAFRLQGAGIFKGRGGGGSWQTLIAYCGGRNPESNVACGKNPIFLGDSVHCVRCGKLICPECHFCSRTCPECAERQERLKSVSVRGEPYYGSGEWDDKRL